MPSAPSPDDAGPDGFSGTHAFAVLERWLAAPRGLGDARRERSISLLVDTLARTGARIERVDHEAVDGDQRYALSEIVAHLRPDATRRFVLATHFDTRPWADEEPDPTRHREAVPGANDGTSGLAVVLALIEPLQAALPEQVGFSIVLFDGEELGHPGDPEGYCMGSRMLGGRIREGAHPLLAAAELGIVLDMVGDRDLHVRVEPSSRANHPQLVDHLWRTAAALGIDAFEPDGRGLGIVDDHKFLTAAGIPSVLLIDREYAAWHRTSDTLDQVSARSLDAVGDVVLRGLTTWFGASPRPRTPAGPVPPRGDDADTVAPARLTSSDAAAL